MGKYITAWRRAPPDNVLDWDFHVSMNIEDAAIVVKNIKARGVHQYFTYALGDKITDLSSEY
jgi:hypothetical protein